MDIFCCIYLLRKPEVRAFVCSVSSVVGLVCYALSSSFNDLFGEWTNWKILLYVFISYIICLGLWLAKAREGSTSPSLQLKLSILVGVTSSVYAYYFGRKVKGKPDAYNLLSSIAFAIMSLGLSTLSHFGFEINLMNFFIGLIITPLMKKNLWLAIVGVCALYSLYFFSHIFNCLLRIGAYTRLSNQNQLVIDIDSTILSSGSTWLRKPEIWTFVCSVSSVVGLVCFALSSSFNYLFGEWTNWKIILYVFISYCICVLWYTMAMAKGRQHSTSPWPEINSAFLVLLITSVYSHYNDKLVTGKPNAYSLLSSTAFAIMSLGLSTLSHFGFEVDLMGFFISLLIAQLMEIRVWLVIVGGTVGYCLIILCRILNRPPGIGVDTDTIPSNQNYSVIGPSTLSIVSQENSSQAVTHSLGAIRESLGRRILQRQSQSMFTNTSRLMV